MDSSEGISNANSVRKGIKFTKANVLSNALRIMDSHWLKEYVKNAKI